MKLVSATLLVLLSMLVASSYAHHSSAPHFDESKTIEVEGTVTKFMFVNPHAYIYFNVADEAGKSVPWRCELSARAALERLGWSESLFPAGVKIKVKGAPARREEHVCYTTNITFADGRVIGRAQQFSSSSSAASSVVTSKTSTRPARQADGHPNLAGNWVSQDGPTGGMGGGGEPGAGGMGGPPGGGGMGGESALLLTPAGEAASSKYDSRYDDPALQCNAANIFFGWTHDQNVNKITQSKDEIVLTYGYMDLVRVIHMNMTEHLKKITPSTAGHSIGKWEGDVLVVDTIGFKPSVLIPISGKVHSDKLHTTERFTVDNVAGTLTRDYVAEDSLYLQIPYKGRDVVALSAQPYQPFKCVELSGKNNIRPK